MLNSTMGAIVFLLTRIPIPIWVRPLLLGVMARLLKIDIHESKKWLNEFRTIDDFFTREIHPKFRPIGKGLVSPADAKVVACGQIQDGLALQIKGIHYEVAALLGNVSADAFEGGSFLNLYLSPKDCHRVFSPMAGTLNRVIAIPGTLLSVSLAHTARIENLYTKNTRVVFEFVSELGKFWVVMVAATNVSSISSPLVPDFFHKGFMCRVKTEQPFDIPVQIAQHLGTFHLGSTVVLVTSFPVEFDEDIVRGDWLPYGSTLSHS